MISVRTTASKGQVLRLVAALQAVAMLMLAPSALSAVQLGDEAWTEFTAIPGLSTTPDSNTRVYQSVHLAGPLYETVVAGYVPRARYWSLALLDQLNAEIDAINDTQIHLAPDGTYEVVVREGCDGAHNCLDAGKGLVPGTPARMLYRLYVPEPDEQGGVPLPSVAYRLLLPAPLPVLKSPMPPGVWTELVSNAVQPLRPGNLVHDVLAAPSLLASPVASGETAPRPPVERFVQSGFGATVDNAYVTVTYSLDGGNLLIRSKAPSYRQQGLKPHNDLGRDDGSEQVRYWSLCTNQVGRPVDCLRDENVNVDSDGFFELIVAPECPVGGYSNCLRGGLLGAAFQGSVLYRNLLAAPDFANSRGPQGCPAPPSQFCGEYAVDATYIPRS